jgi:hypothetical protein
MDHTSANDFASVTDDDINHQFRTLIHSVGRNLLEQYAAGISPEIWLKQV